ncbi:terminase large subunit domain-containing protein [Streptomyces sp. NPDC020898]|uniref:terminase large subunit domain-containing protein n=1 Tax=Streptomyces sp. NPDC020898 TaxID=3365101 RepID=UPI00378C6903
MTTTAGGSGTPSTPGATTSASSSRQAARPPTASTSSAAKAASSRPGIGGGLTGRGAHIAIVDDPVKDMADADSPTMRKRAWDWWTSVLQTRLEPVGAICLIQTRWHEDDLAGRTFATERAKQMMAPGRPGGRAGMRPDGHASEVIWLTCCHRDR